MAVVDMRRLKDDALDIYMQTNRYDAINYICQHFPCGLIEAKNLFEKFLNEEGKSNV